MDNKEFVSIEGLDQRGWFFYNKGIIGGWVRYGWSKIKLEEIEERLRDEPAIVGKVIKEENGSSMDIYLKGDKILVSLYRGNDSILKGHAGYFRPYETNARHAIERVWNRTGIVEIEIPHEHMGSLAGRFEEYSCLRFGQVIKTCIDFGIGIESAFRGTEYLRFLCRNGLEDDEGIDGIEKEIMELCAYERN